MHLICLPPPSPQILHNLCFSFFLGITAVPREIENNASAKFWGVSKVLKEDVQVAYEGVVAYRLFSLRIQPLLVAKSINGIQLIFYVHVKSAYFSAHFNGIQLIFYIHVKSAYCYINLEW